MRHQPIRLLAQPSYEGAYDIDQDPLWTHTAQALPIDVLAWYQCDHLGTPQELTDPNGQLAWSAQYKAWGEIKEQRSEWAQREGLTNPIRFQGQYHDHETGLHYNRYRYYDPWVGRFISKDPISYAGGLNLYAYAPNPVEWVDPNGLCSKKLDRALGGSPNDGMQAHHLIPEQVWKEQRGFFSDIGMLNQQDNKENGLLMPTTAIKAKKMKRVFYHCGSHGRVYTPVVSGLIERVRDKYESGEVDEAQARIKITAIQNRLRISLSAMGAKQRRVK